MQTGSNPEGSEIQCCEPGFLAWQK